MCMALKNSLKLTDHQQPPVQIQNNSSQFCNLNPHGQQKQNQSNNYSMEFDQHQQPPVQKQTTT